MSGLTLLLDRQGSETAAKEAIEYSRKIYGTKIAAKEFKEPVPAIIQETSVRKMVTAKPNIKCSTSKSSYNNTSPM